MKRKKIALPSQLGQVIGDLFHILADGGHERLLEDVFLLCNRQ